MNAPLENIINMPELTAHDSPESLGKIAAIVGYAGYHWDLKNDRIRWYGDWSQIFGQNCEKPPMNSEELYSLVFSGDRHLVFVDGGESFEREYRIQLPEGRVTWLCESGTTGNEHGAPVWQRGLIRIISAPSKRVANPVTTIVLECDPLTGCTMRSHMTAQINHWLLSNAAGEESNVGIYLAINIDKMGFVNEALGREAADTLLRGVADRLNDILPEGAVLSRVGGDIFGMLLSKSDVTAQELAEKILTSFRDRPVDTLTFPIHITVSIGGAQLTKTTCNANDVITRAEQALREARNRGRNRYIEYHESSLRTEESSKLLRVGEIVKKSLKYNRLRMAFQPIVDATTEKIICYEALARVFDENGAPIPAGYFIPAAEQQGLAIDLDYHVFNLIVNELEAYPDLVLAMNISGLTAAHANWPQHMQTVLNAHPGVASRLIIEITETAAIMDVTETRRFADILNHLGGRVAMDDFGAGFTSIRHLRTLALSIMKIDMDLLRNLMENPEQQHLVRMLIGIAKGLGLKTIAEGVEDSTVSEWLRRENVDMMQGYYFGKPSFERLE